METKAASCDDPDTWMTFDDSLRLLKSSKIFKGLNVALSPKPPQEGKETLVGIDIDKALLPDGTRGSQIQYFANFHFCTNEAIKYLYIE